MEDFETFSRRMGGSDLEEGKEVGGDGCVDGVGDVTIHQTLVRSSKS